LLLDHAVPELRARHTLRFCPGLLPDEVHSAPLLFLGNLHRLSRCHKFLRPIDYVLKICH